MSAARETELRDLVARVAELPPDEVDLGESVLALGFDSLMAVTLQHAAEAELGLALPAPELLAGRAPRDLLDTVAVRAATARSRPERVPLSPAQRRMWFLDRLDPGAYAVAGAVRLPEGVPDAVLADALTAAVARHEALRTVYPGDDPAQEVLPPAPVPLPAHPGSRAEAVAALLAEPFDLVRGPVLRALRRGDELLVAVHHIACDGWSLTVLLDELRAHLAGESVPAPATQYPDYALAQAERLDAVRDVQLAHWRAALDGAPPAVDLPADGDPAATAPITAVRPLPAALADGVRDFAREHGVTAFAVLGAAFAVLLGRLSRQDEVVLGTPVANRHDPALERAVGLFVNTVALRAHLDGDFTAAATAFHQSTVDALRHQDLPFDEVVDALGVPRDPDRNPVYQALFTVRQGPGTADLPAEELAVGSAKLAVALTVETGLDTFARWEFDGRRVAATSARRYAECFETLLAALLAEPRRPVADAALVDPRERARLLGPPLPAPRHRPVRLAETDGVALISGDERIGYPELAARVDALAGRLRAHGVGPDSTVGLYAHRGPDLVVGLLAVLAAGGAYAPLDPAYPTARLSAILEDARPTAVLAPRKLIADLPAPSCPALAIDEPGGPSTGEVVPEHPDDLAYVLHTSGSTGVPKGVAVTRGNLSALLSAMDEVLGGGRQTWLAVTSPAFDISVVELIWTLTRGHAVVLADERSAGVAELVAEHGVTHLQTTPSFATRLLAAHPGAFAGLDVLLLGGEPFSPELMALLRELPATRVVNGYGPTEATVYATTHDVDPASGRAPMGAPVAGTAARLLDRRGEPVPDGVTGELFLAGPGVARGYLGKPALTAERFVPDPHGAPGSRAYRTGDLARRRGGALEFLGRADRQVKVRGYRIELGDVAAALAEHPGVERAHPAVVDGELVAYLVGTADPDALSAHLRDRLPSWMHPSHFVVLPELPLSPNGKVDTARLPAPDARRAEAKAPGTPTERAIADIWRDLLETDEPITADVSFFALGGHSLLATRLTGRLARDLRVDLPLRSVFSHPTVAGLARLVATAPATAPAAWRAGPRPERIPLSPAQHALWFLDRLSPGSDAYTMAGAVRVDGALDPAVLADRLTAVVARHEVLRTVFPADADGPRQVVLPPSPVPLPVVRSAAEVVAAPFDLAAGPLVRAGLLRRSDTEHELVIAVHHIVCDGWSLEVLLSDLIVDRAEPPVQYADHTLAARGSDASAELTAYWVRRLAGAPPSLELPADRPRTRAGGPGASLDHALPAAVADGVRAVAAARGASAFMVLHAGFSALLSRLSGQTDVVVGTPVANRRGAHLETAVGLYVNTVALRTDLADDPGFAALVDRVRDDVLAAHRHQDLPFEDLVRAVAVDRDATRNPLFQTMFAVRERPLPEAGLPDGAGGSLRLRARELRTGTAKFDLTLTVHRGADGVLIGRWEYDSALFDAATVARMAACLDRLLTGALADPDRPLSRVPLLDAPARAAALARADRTGATPYPARAGARPDAVALVSGGERVTYRELDLRADALAARLRALGVGPDVPVGLHAPRGVAQVVGLHAVLRAGGAYVPLDPTHPPARLGRVLADARPPVVLSTDPATLPPHDAAVLDPGAVLAPAPKPAEPDALPEHLAYVIYTSGSTGVPKGVAVTRANLAALLAAMDDLLDDGGHQTWLGLTSPAFDISVVELVWTITRGHTVVLADQGSGPLAGSVVRHGVTHVQTTPSFATRLLREAPAVAADLRVLLLGGEAFPPELVRRLRGLRDVRVINGYGPTEATVYATTFEFDRARDAVPIGGPLPGVAARVLDRHGEPVPDGVAGELHLSGATVARGYLGNPALTAERFRPDPHGPAGARAYRTGDLARARGCEIEFLGRGDHQVKIRGYRIEPAEVTAVLSGLPGVRRAHTAVRRDGGEPVLVAYLETDDPDTGPALVALRANLPAWLHPAHVVPVSALPLTVNGKVDADALPAPAAEVVRAEPATPVQRRIAAVWAEALGVASVGAHDGFFAIGGHSLLATQVVGRLTEEFGVDLPLRSVFDHPTVAGLAAVVEAAAPARRRGPRPGGGDATPSFAQRRMWFLDQLTEGTAYTVAAAVELTGPLDEAALRAALSAVVARHDALRTVFSADGESTSVLPAERVPLPGVASADEVVAERFDLARGPLLRAGLVRRGADDHELVVAVHHIACDGWSLGVLLEDLVADYRHALGAGPAATPPPVSYRDFATWQRERLAGGESLAHWRGVLAGAPDSLELPGDRPRPVVAGHAGATVRTELPATVAGRLAAVAESAGTTLFTAVHAAFAVLLARVSGQSDVVVGTPVANRDDPALERVVGFFANTLPLRTELGDDPGFAELLGRAHTAALAAREHQELPFEHLVDALGLPRDPGRNPLFQAMVTLVHPTPAPTPPPGLALAVREVETAAAKVDLTLTATADRAGPMALRWEYRTDLFDEATIVAFAGAFAALVDALTADPARPVSRAPLTADPMLGAPLAAAPARLLPESIAEQVRRTPDAPALDGGGVRLTYGELDARSAAIAARLRDLGVGPDVLVGVHAHRGPALIVGIVAVLRAGGAYVPLDPTYPAARLAAVVADAAPAAVLTGPGLGSFGDVPAVPISAPWPARPAPDPGVRPEHLAYVIHTSGSTGTPKGVMVTHGALAASTDARARVYGGSPAGFALLSSISFDTSVASVFWSLATGALLHLPPDGAQLDLDLLEALARRDDVSHMVLLPSLYRELLGRLADDPPALATVVVAGEPLTSTVVDLHHAVLPDVPLHNEYGPTENTVWSTVARCAPGGPVTIGSVVPGVLAAVLDAHGEPLPPGVPGELHVSGHHLARGYLGRPALTADRFRPDPLGAPGARRYRTGDVVRRRADGELDFLGRTDRQVKLRGYRVELDEVAAVLAAAPGVRRAHAEVRAGALVGYLHCADDALPGVRALAAERLPSWMVPGRLVALAGLPTTPNGKVDAAALPDPAPVAAASAPGTPLELRVAEIWQDLLAVPSVDPERSFFELGGHSLLLVRARELLRPLRPDLTVVDLFRYPTVRALAAFLADAPAPVAADRADALRAGRGRLRRRASADPAEEATR